MSTSLQSTTLTVALTGGETTLTVDDTDRRILLAMTANPRSTRRERAARSISAKPSTRDARPARNDFTSVPIRTSPASQVSSMW